MRLLAILLLVAGSLVAQPEADTKDGFDHLQKTTVVDFGPSRYYENTQHVRNKLTCFYYPEITVKEYDEGQKGAEWLSIVPAPHAAFTKEHRGDEKVIDWNGYFSTAKGIYAMFSSADGEDGGLPFAVFDAKTGDKLFRDSSLLPYHLKKLHLNNAFRVTTGANQELEFHYFRVVRAECSLKRDPAGCWTKLRAELGIMQTDIPRCSGYEQADWNSAVVYPVSVLLTKSPSVKAADGPVFCWPID